MHVSTIIATLALAFQATVISADSLTILAIDIPRDGLRHNGIWHTSTGNFSVDASEGCKKDVGVPGVGGWCMDWKNHHSSFWAFGHKRCFKQAVEFPLDCYDHSISDCHATARKWPEVPCPDQGNGRLATRGRRGGNLRY